MSNFIKKLTILFLSIFIITACSKESGNNTEQKQSKGNDAAAIGQVDESEDTENAEDAEDAKEQINLAENKKIPASLEEIISYPKGPFTAEDTQIKDPEVQQALSKVPELPEEASEEELNDLFAYLYSLFRKEYRDPREAIVSLTVSGPESEGSSEEKGSFNVEIILDSSGSMANKMGSQTRMELAKASIKKFASALPEEANVGLRVYGHKGTGSDADKKMSCASNELVYAPQPYNEAELSKALNKFKPAGWTPLAQSLMEAQKDLEAYKGEKNKNIVYVVSDGIETCDGNPVEAAASLKDSGVAPVVNIIGFDVNGKDQQQLEEVAQAAGGTYQNVKSQEQLDNELEKAIEESGKWIKWYVDETGKNVQNNIRQKDELLSISNDWIFNQTFEEYRIISALNALQIEGKITGSQNTKVVDIRNKYYRGQKETFNEIEKVLMDMIEQGYDENEKKINELYDKNIQ
ncbi:VWA domain-containing protein [Bacillus infantis]|uniref:VWA domain-containing protein n=1 Tax=Bacillus infantis TaxID=324767 RepID=A0A5D4S8F0_9BACI|nr:VWA domain-containing protein [Bacillus infantis]TYS57936.1 VWA domain-containing protein [Bacillus infantis]